MRKIFILIVCLSAFMTHGRAQDMVADFLKKQNNPAVFTQVNINAKMFQLIADMTDAETESIIQNLTGMKIITAAQKTEEYFKVSRQMLENPSAGYENLMNVKEENEEVWMYIRESKGCIAELVILVGEKGKFVLMNFIGKIDLKKISRLTKSVNISGVEYLNKVKDTGGNKSPNVHP